ncbi:MAG: hypothetical protein ABH803_00280 [Candidatus Micrarchaeota archaeon]
MAIELKLLHNSEKEFAEKVKQSKGKIVFLVQPFFTLPDEAIQEKHLFSPEDAVQLKDYYSKMRRLNEKVKLPIVVLIRDAHAGFTHKFLGKANPFFVYSKASDPISGWDNLSAVFNKMGVKKILLGGMHSGSFSLYAPPASLVEHERKVIKNPKVRMNRTVIWANCVGVAYRSLVERKHEVFLLKNLLYPEKP